MTVVHAGAIAALIAAGAFVLLVLLLAIPLVKLGRTLDEATLAIRTTHEGAVPLLAQAQTAMTNVNTQLTEVEDITRGVNSITSNVAALTAIVSSTVSSPLIKVAAFSYGVRSSVHKRQDVDAAKEARRARTTSRSERRALGRGR
jgi:uncharacterized protein YoxC